MNQEKMLKLQAYVDGELSGREQQEMAAAIELDAEMQTLCQGLKSLRQLCQAGELPVQLPESREFYWSKIEKAIGRESMPTEPSRSASPHSWWYRLAVTLAGAAVVLAAVLTTLRLTTAPATMSYLHEIETPLEDTSAISFHSQASGMTVVWVQSQEN